MKVAEIKIQKKLFKKLIKGDFWNHPVIKIEKDNLIAWCKKNYPDSEYMVGCYCCYTENNCIDIRLNVLDCSIEAFVEDISYLKGEEQNDN